MRSGPSRVARGFAATAAGSFLVMSIQFIYALGTSRWLPPAAFGAYAVAMAGVGLMGMLSGTALGTTAARREEESSDKDGALLGSALLLSAAVTTIAVLLATAWCTLWGIPDATQVTQILSLSLPFSTLLSVYGGILRRRGRTSFVSARTAAGQILGALVGAVVVYEVREPWTLGISMLVGSAGAMAFVGSGLTPTERMPGLPSAASRADLAYSVKVSALNVFRYGVTVIPGWSISRFAGPINLGYYNRATTLSTVPLTALSGAFSFALFPELRPGGSVSRSKQTFTGIMILLSWPTVVIGGLGYLVAGPLLVLVLGTEWQGIQSIAGIAVLIGAIPIVGVPVGSLIEARGHFRAASLAWALAAVPLALGVWGTARLGTAEPAMLGLLGYTICLFLAQLLAAARQGYVSLHALTRATWGVVALQMAVTASTQLWLSTSDWSVSKLTATALVVATIEVAFLWLVRKHTPFGKVAAAYGLPGFRTR